MSIINLKTDTTMKEMKTIVLLILFAVLPMSLFAQMVDVEMKVGDYKVLKAPESTNSSYPLLSSKTEWNYSGDAIEVTNTANLPAAIVIKAVAPGHATVTCKACYWSNENPGNVYKSVVWNIFVEEDVIAPTDIRIASEVTIPIGGTTRLVSSLSPDNAKTTITWKSYNTNIATVDEDGVVKGVSAGQTVVAATTANGLTDVCIVTVKDESAPTKKGDINGDGKINVGDIMAIINLMAAGEQPQETTYYWYVGHDNPMNMSSITPLSSNAASAGAGWRTIGNTLPTYSKQSPLWDSNSLIATASSKSTQYVALPSASIKSRNDITEADITGDNWTINPTKKTLNGVQCTVWTSINTKKSFGETLY